MDQRLPAILASVLTSFHYKIMYNIGSEKDQTSSHWSSYKADFWHKEWAILAWVIETDNGSNIIKAFKRARTTGPE